jgi:hypothetical protein
VARLLINYQSAIRATSELSVYGAGATRAHAAERLPYC